MTSLYPSTRWAAPAAATGLWALAAASAVFWGLRLSAPPDALAPPATAPATVAPDPAAVARLLGAVPAASTAVAAPEASSRFALFGVVADGTRHGTALISIDGKPPQPFRVGGAVGEGYVLQSLGLRAATLGTGPNTAPAFTLQLPVRAPIGVASAMATPAGAGAGMVSGPISLSRSLTPYAPASASISPPPASALVPTGPIGAPPPVMAPQGEPATTTTTTQQ